jgi:hypothetical protein
MTDKNTPKPSAGFEKLEELHAKLGKVKGAGVDLTQVEEEIRGALDEVGVEMMATALRAADRDGWSSR